MKWGFCGFSVAFRFVRQKCLLDFLGKSLRNIRVPWHGFNVPGFRIAPQ